MPPLPGLWHLRVTFYKYTAPTALVKEVGDDVRSL